MLTSQFLSPSAPNNLAGLEAAVVDDCKPIDGKRLPMTKSAHVDMGVQKILEQFMRQCGLSTLALPPYDTDLHKASWEEARRRGYFTGDESIDRVLGQRLNVGIAIAYTTYAHLKNQRIKVLVAVTTALLSYVDDVFQNNAGEIMDFTQRFLQGQPQGHPVLDSLAHCLLEFRKDFDSPIADLMLTCCLDYMSAQSLEYGILTKEMPLSSKSLDFLSFVRFISGAPSFYVLTAFPPEVPLSSYIQAVPYLIQICNHSNDVLSFYKEEVAGEQANYVTNMAACLQISKIDALRKLADDTADAATRALKIASGHPGAYEAVQGFVQGYVWFHLASPRYKLRDLFVYQMEDALISLQYKGTDIQ